MTPQPLTDHDKETLTALARIAARTLFNKIFLNNGKHRQDVQPRKPDNGSVNSSRGGADADTISNVPVMPQSIYISVDGELKDLMK